MLGRLRHEVVQWRKFTAICLALCLLPMPTLAKPVKSMEQAIAKVKKSVAKNKLTQVPAACLDFRIVQSSLREDFPQYYVDIYHKASAQCAEKEKKLFGYAVNKAEGWLQTNAIARPCYKNTLKSKPYPCEPVGEFYVAIDPVSPVIVYDPPHKTMHTK